MVGEEAAAGGITLSAGGILEEEAMAGVTPTAGWRKWLAREAVVGDTGYGQLKKLIVQLINLTIEAPGIAWVFSNSQ